MSSALETVSLNNLRTNCQQEISYSKKPTTYVSKSHCNDERKCLRRRSEFPFIPHTVNQALNDGHSTAKEFPAFTETENSLSYSQYHSLDYILNKKVKQSHGGAWGERRYSSYSFLGILIDSSLCIVLVKYLMIKFDILLLRTPWLIVLQTKCLYARPISLSHMSALLILTMTKCTNYRLQFFVL
jgi:hypothetical protein